ncbi:MAG: hypothetical protein ACFE8E_14030 [Candidatus Hodarchaeota archaeon]
MKKSYFILGIFLLGILIFATNFNQVLAYEEGEGEDDNCEDETKRHVEIWFGENVIEAASIKCSDDKKDIMDLRIGYNEYGISIAVSFSTMTKIVCEEECESEEEHTVKTSCEDWEYEEKLRFEVLFKSLIEYVDLNENGIFDIEEDTCVGDYGINSFHTPIYTPINISDDSVLHYFIINTTDGIFATHIYFPEEFVIVDGNLISPTQIKIDIEITNYNYIDDNSQLALYTKLFSEDYYNDKEETEDENDGVATDEKEVYTDNGIYRGIFSWKETAMIDGVEMPVLTNELEFECKEENIQMLLFNYPRGNHIYHDPKIGIVFINLPASDFPMILIGSIAGVAGLIIVGTTVIMKKRRIR